MQAGPTLVDDARVEGGESYTVCAVCGKTPQDPPEPGPDKHEEPDWENPTAPETHHRRVRWLFVTGIALDIGGAVLVLGAILFARPREVAEEAVSTTGFNEARLRARIQERRYAYGGAVLLASGFILQLVGYAWTFSSWWMLGGTPSPLRCQRPRSPS